MGQISPVTVTIQSNLFGTGFVIINADDYDQSEDVLYESGDPEKDAQNLANATLAISMKNEG
jgi:hypothetical protein